MQQPRQATFSMVNCPSASVSSARGDFQAALERFMHPLGALDVTGGAVTDADNVAADGMMAELAVEGRHARNRRRRDLRQFADAPQGLGRQIAVMLLDRPKDGDQGVRAAAESLDGLVDVG